MSDRLKAILGFVVFLLYLFFVGKGFLPFAENFLPPKEPKFVTAIPQLRLMAGDVL
jgi:hypothetical protein